MIYRTCPGCVFEKQPCTARDQLRETIKGFCITSIKWKCKQRVPRISIGDPVWAMTVASTTDMADTGEPYRDYFPAVAVKDCGTKMVVFIEPGAPGRENGSDLPFNAKGSGFCKIPLSRLTAREGKREEVCRYCEQPASKGHAIGYSCNPDDRWME